MAKITIQVGKSIKSKIIMRRLSGWTVGTRERIHVEVYQEKHKGWIGRQNLKMIESEAEEIGESLVTDTTQKKREETRDKGEEEKDMAVYMEIGR